MRQHSPLTKAKQLNRSARSGNGLLFNLMKQMYEKKLLVAFAYS
ncbi:hypothetical protein CLV59_101147 [Chitinophaga dinghuensis]|uniref:Uncharacterized protein n=1 Tax=Chitinophaga dinghuensis TaxID=1539050 RepID=A0A327WB64_9BACT|nr:hypothetical protein CLV59_101147 [Chitinophaga dinghuensis]